MRNTHGTAADVCERVLKNMREYYSEKNIYPDIIIVIDHMIKRRLELEIVYEEIYEKLALRHNALWVFFDLALASATQLNEERSVEARKCRSELKHLNKKISDAAAVLSDLLLQRNDLQEGSGFWSDTHYHIVDVIDAAAQDNPHYQGWLKEPLYQLRGRFDFKYWPSLSELIGVIADDSEEAVVEASNPLIGALTQNQRHSRSDFFRALFQMIDQNRRDDPPYLPESFHLTDAAYAALGTCLLGLGPDDTIEATYIKGFRQREKEQSENTRLS